MWIVFSAPRLSNFPKSLEFGTIESPVPFDWSVIRGIRIRARMIITGIKFIDINKKTKMFFYYIRKYFFANNLYFIFAFFEKICYSIGEF